MFQKLSNSLIPLVEDAQLVSRLVKVSSYFLSICGVRLFGSRPDHVPACTYCTYLGIYRNFYASKRCSSRSDHRLYLLVLEHPLSSLLDFESINATWRLDLLRYRNPNVNEAISPSSSSRTTGPCTRSLFEFCRTAHPDSPFALAREGSKDVFPRTAFVLYPE
jgi:hypothetical protein